jgi:hypothetical protein
MATSVWSADRFFFKIDAAVCRFWPQDSAFFAWYHEERPSLKPMARQMHMQLAALPNIRTLIEQDLEAIPFSLVHLHPFAPWGTWLEINQAAVQALLKQSVGE